MIPLTMIEPRSGCKAEFLQFEDYLHLIHLHTPVEKRGQGGASRLMRQITAVADAHDTEIRLEPVPEIDSPLDRKRLVKFYKKYGFRWGSLWEDQIMIRKPRRKRKAFV